MHSTNDWAFRKISSSNDSLETVVEVIFESLWIIEEY